MANKVAIAIGAHPDDIEFYMAGTLLMLKKAGYEAHYLNLASGNCGSADYNVTVYHAMPHSLRDGLRRRVIPGAFVNTTSVHQIKHEALAAHKSQGAWLDVSQGLSSYLLAMEDLSLAVGQLSKRFKHAEG